MKEDIEIMSKEIERIRDQILKNPQMLTPTKVDVFQTPEKIIKRKSFHKRSKAEADLDN